MAALTAKTSNDQKAVTPLRMVVMSAMLAMVQAVFDSRWKKDEVQKGKEGVCADLRNGTSRG
jgi:hypothetical protein